ncbi:MAG TPA: hypothetical protein VG737_13070 [Cyclobacteriaceae bacterium]|nr:hypothetical protein [Cyclobacteriaceae bacterium]
MVFQRCRTSVNFIEKKKVNYTFRKSPKSAEVSITLDDYGFLLREGDHQEKISYANIVAVRICRQPNHIYRVYLYPDESRAITISSLSWDSDGKQRDQSREYTLFVRVLHHHLKDKSPAVFTSGGNASKIWKLAGILAFLCFLASVIIDYLGFGLFNPYTQALVLALVCFLIVILSSIRNFPKTYTPTDIPLQFLP